MDYCRSCARSVGKSGDLCKACNAPVVSQGNKYFLELFEPFFHCRDFEFGSFQFGIFADALKYEPDLMPEERAVMLKKAIAVESVVRDWLNKKRDKNGKDQKPGR